MNFNNESFWRVLQRKDVRQQRIILKVAQQDCVVVEKTKMKELPAVFGGEKHTNRANTMTES